MTALTIIDSDILMDAEQMFLGAKAIGRYDKPYEAGVSETPASCASSGGCGQPCVRRRAIRPELLQAPFLLAVEYNIALLTVSSRPASTNGREGLAAVFAHPGITAHVSTAVRALPGIRLRAWHKMGVWSGSSRHGRPGLLPGLSAAWILLCNLFENGVRALL